MSARSRLPFAEAWTPEFQKRLNDALEERFKVLNEFALVPYGGTQGQALVKKTDRPYELEWGDAVGGGTVEWATCEEADAGVVTDKAINPEVGACSYDRKRVWGQHEAGKGTETVTLTPVSGVVTIDGHLSNVFRLSMEGNYELANPTNPIPGQTINIHLIQDSTGGRTLTFGTQWKFVNRITPTLTPDANAKDMLSCQWDEVESVMKCSFLPHYGSGYTPPATPDFEDFAFVNVGGGNELFRDVVGTDVNFRTIVGDGDITVSTSGDTVVVSYTASTETPSLHELNDMQIDDVQIDDSIKWDGTNWVRSPPPDIPDLSVYSFLTLDDHFDPLASSLRIVAGENVSFTVVDNTLTIAAATEPGTVPQNKQNGNYTLVATDSGAHIYKDGGGAATWTIPSNASVAFGLGTVLTFVNDDAEDVTIAIDTDTLVLSPGGTTGSRTLGQYGMATAIKVNTTRWIISGTELT